MPRYFGFEAVGALVYDPKSKNLFSDPEAQSVENDEEAPENLSEDDDDAKLAHNSRAAVEMSTPTKLKRVKNEN